MLDSNAQLVVLVVADDNLAHSVSSNMLALKSSTVLEGATPLEAMALLRSRQRIDLLITDVHMPGSVDGGQFVKMARVVRPDLKVLYVTGYADKLLHDLADESGTDILKKPFPLNSFLAKVSAMIFPQPPATSIPALQPQQQRPEQ